MFSKLLIANRGEIACRVIKTAKNMGIKTVAVYSEIDHQALHVQMADEAVCIGPASAKDSYLQGQKIIDVALATQAQAIHPGYGFLSENAEFAKLCEQNHIVFVGPPVSAIQAMGSKSAAKQIMQEADVPLVPGYHGNEQSEEVLKSHVDSMGYPVLLKAAAGGGGKGMRQVWHQAEFAEALAAAKREAMSSFADDKMLVEKYLTQPRHVEIQVFCDNHGNGVYLFERDCSVQRRHQKVIEEAPAPGLSQELREQMGQAALKAAKAINYRGAGTVEFLLDQDGQFYFMEMNTRLQVEHPVTEMITGQDLVEWQLMVANNQTLPLSQAQLSMSGHAFEARIYAEDADNDFLPATGTLSLLKTPLASESVRIETGVQQGDEVSIYYDPMIAKLVVWGPDRDQALHKLKQALSEYRIDGVTTNLEFLHRIANHPAFRAAELTTNFIEEHNETLLQAEQIEVTQYLPLAALSILLSEQASLALQQHTDSPWHTLANWRMNHNFTRVLEVEIGQQVHQVKVSQNTCDKDFIIQIGEDSISCSGQITGQLLKADIDGHQTSYSLNQTGEQYSLFADGRKIEFRHIQADLSFSDESAADASLSAPMNGRIVTLLAQPGQAVKKDQALVVMEAMKMEHSIKAPADGEVEEFFYQAGDLVDGGAALLSFSVES